MAATQVNLMREESLPKPIPFNMDHTTEQDPILSAPKKPKTTNRAKVEMEVEQSDSVSGLFEETFTGMNEEWSTSPMDKIERVFFDNATSTLYKLFIDGTWESLKFVM